MTCAYSPSCGPLHRYQPHRCPQSNRHAIGSGRRFPYVFSTGCTVCPLLFNVVILSACVFTSPSDTKNSGITDLQSFTGVTYFYVFVQGVVITGRLSAEQQSTLARRRSKTTRVESQSTIDPVLGPSKTPVACILT